VSRAVILDPTAPPPIDEKGAGPDAGALAGRVVGIRLDRAWRSFHWVADEWSRALRELGAEVRTWVAGNRIGEEGERTRRELQDFAAALDVAIVGLGN
jgi:hypothetical protein